MRAFIAIELPDTIKAALHELIGRLREAEARVSWVRPEHMHLTLRFLGEITPADALRLEELLALRYQGMKHFELQVCGTGAFPNIHRPSVIWAGITGSGNALDAVQAIAEEEACALGLPRERRPFTPHLTLARIKEAEYGKRLMPYLSRERDFEGGAFPVAGVSLFSSELTPQGPIHRRLREFLFS